jgi:hypothetical protein
MLKACLRRKNPSKTHSRTKLLTKKTLNGREGIFNVTFTHKQQSNDNVKMFCFTNLSYFFSYESDTLIHFYRFKELVLVQDYCVSYNVKVDVFS